MSRLGVWLRVAVGGAWGGSLRALELGQVSYLGC